MNLEKTIKNLENRGYNVVYVKDKSEALDTILSHISKDECIAFGGSTTLTQLGVVEHILSNDYNVLNRYEEGLTPEEVFEVERQSLLSDIFITSTNTIAETGELVNIDGKGNRVAAQIFGPKKVFLVTGTNKIAKDLDSAMIRAQEHSAPINAKRFEKLFKTGCTDTGVCVKCVGPTTICKSIVTTRRASKPGRTTIFLIEEELGF